MSPQVARFHRDSGPESLFVRVRQVFSGVRRLRLHGSHLARRVANLDAPLADLDHFDPTDWELVLVEARADNGKFVSTTWRRRYPAAEWWVVVGYGDTVRTLYRASPNKRAYGARITTEGPLWELVDRANSALAAEEDPT